MGIKSAGDDAGGHLASLTTDRHLIAIVTAGAIAVTAFVFDLSVPLGVAGGVPYVALVVIGNWLPRPSHTYALGLIGTVLTIAGYFLSSEGSEQWIVLTNRALAIFAIWITVLLIVSRTKTRKVRDEKIRELDFQKHALDEHAIVSITDIKGRITYINDKFCEISGYTRDELMGNNHRILKSGEHGSEVYQDLWCTVSSGKTWHGEIKNRTKEGEYYWVQATIVPFLNAKGRPFQYVSIRTDITKRKEAEELAEAANEAKSSFLSSMSHELRTPMNAILGFAQMMKYTPKESLSEQQSESIDNILKAGGYLMELINQVLELSKIETGKITLDIGNVSARNVLDDCLIIVAGRAEREGITIEDRFDGENLPLLRTDGTRLTQVLLNLLSNAVKYNRPGGSVILSCEQAPGNMMRIIVADTGNGIPPEKQDDLFKPFDRLGREARNIEGTGVGLTIAKQVIELLGGAIGFESVENEGSTFWIDVPKVQKQVNIDEMFNHQPPVG